MPGAVSRALVRQSRCAGGSSNRSGYPKIPVRISTKRSVIPLPVRAGTDQGNPLEQGISPEQSPPEVLREEQYDTAQREE